MNIGSIEVMLGANTAGLSRAAVNMKRFETQVLGSNARMQSSFQALGSRMMLTGTMMTQFLTVPIALLGGVGLKTFAQFESSLVKMAALTSFITEEIKKMANELLKMSASVGRSPKELAEGLYFIGSSGIKDTALAMDILKVSANAARIGLGDTKVVADALTSVMNAYGKENITAAEAINAMTVATREGKGEADAMTRVYGKVMPLAVQLGVSFNEVAGSLATLTLTGKSAAEASTQLARLFTTLIQAPPRAEKALESMGVSFKKLRETLKNEGMVGFMNQFKDMIGGNKLDVMQSTKAYEDNIEVLGEVFTNIRALLPVLDMMGPNFDNLKRVINAVNTENQAFANGVGKVSGSIQDKWNRTVSGMTVSLIKFGDVIKGPLMGIIQNFADWISKIADNFAKLPESTQGTIVSFTLITAALGPLMLILGPLVSAMANLIGFMVGGSLAAGVGWFLLLAAAIYEVYKNWELVKKAFANFDWNSFGKGILAAVGSPIPGLSQGIAMMQGMQGALINAYTEWNKYSSTVKGAENNMALITEKTKEYNGLVKQMGASTTLEGRKKVYADIEKVLLSLEHAYTGVIDADKKGVGSKGQTEGMMARVTILEELRGSAEQMVNDLDVGFGDVFKKFALDGMDAINSLQKMITGLDLSKLSKGFGIGDTGQDRISDKIKKMLRVEERPQKEQGLAKLPGQGISLTEMFNDVTTKAEKYQTIVDMMINNTNDALKNNVEVANALGKSYDKAGEDVNILQEAMKNLTGDNMPDMKELLNLITPEQLTAIQQYLILLEQLKAKTQDNVKVLTAWKNLFRDISSLAGTIGKYLGEGFQQVFSVIQDVVSGVSQFIAIIRDIAKITKLTSTATTVAQIAATTATAAGIPVTLAAAAAEGVKAAASTEAAVAGAASSTSWIPVVGVGLAIAGVIALMAVLNKSKSAKMANGGTVPSGFPNDSFPAMLTSGETIVPAFDSARMFGNGAGTGKQEVVFKIDGRELVGVLQNMGKLQHSY